MATKKTREFLVSAEREDDLIAFNVKGVLPPRMTATVLTLIFVIVILLLLIRYAIPAITLWSILPGVS